ncbi:MAG TPA: response regulator transcription factor [Nakamurella sp.]
MTPAVHPPRAGGTTPQAPPAAFAAPRVALLEERLAVAQSLAVLLGQTPGLIFVGYAPSESALLELLAGARVDVLLVDLDGVDGLAVGARAVVRWPRMRWVALTEAPDDERLAEVFRAGALGLVVTSAEPDALIRAIHGAFRDETHIPPAMLTRLLRHTFRVAGDAGVEPDRPSLARLTARERDVLDSLMQGRSRAETAAWLGMSPNTVRTHTQNLVRTLGVASVPAAIALARRIDPDG